MTFGSNKEARPVEASLTRPDLPWLAGAVLTGGVAAPIILMMGLKHTPATTASLLLNFEGVATTLIAALVFKEAVGRRIIAAMLLVTLASVLLSLDGGGLWGFSLGALGVLAACLLWGLDNNFTRHISAKDPLQIVAIKGLGAGAFSLTLAFALGKSLPDAGRTLLGMLLGLTCYGLSIGLFILAMRGLGSARTSTLFGTAPFMGVLLSILIFREPPNGLFWLSVPLMLVGASLMLSEDHQHNHMHDQVEHDHQHQHPDAHHQHPHPQNLRESGAHSHRHSHAILAHSHPHTPDIHHRHGHQTG
jgi:drug/metabolite transporter (DMT)-like permease